MNAKCNIRINKYKKLSSTIPKSSESFEWKDVNWKKIELRLNVFQNKIIVFLVLLEEPCAVKAACTVLRRGWRL